MLLDHFQLNQTITWFGRYNIAQSYYIIKTILLLLLKIKSQSKYKLTSVFFYSGNRYETSAERWSPVQSIEKILISVVSMLAEPNDESPANVDAAKMWR